MQAVRRLWELHGLQKGGKAALMARLQSQPALIQSKRIYIAVLEDDGWKAKLTIDCKECRYACCFCIWLSSALINCNWITVIQLLLASAYCRRCVLLQLPPKHRCRLCEGIASSGSAGVAEWHNAVKAASP